MAHLLLWLLHAGEAEGERSQAAPTDGPRTRRTQTADGRIRRTEVSARDRLDDALSQRQSLRGDETAARIRRGDRCRGDAARHRRRPGTGAEPVAGVSPRAALAGCRLAFEPADG